MGRMAAATRPFCPAVFAGCLRRGERDSLGGAGIGAGRFEGLHHRFHADLGGVKGHGVDFAESAESPRHFLDARQPFQG